MIANANRLTPYLFLAPAVLILAVALMYPVGYMIWASFLDWNPSQRIGEAEFVGLRNYINLFSEEAFLESMGVTLRFAAVAVSVEMVLGVSLALLLDRQLKGMTILRTVFILPMMIAPIMVGLMWRDMYHPTVGILNRTLKSISLDPVPWLSDGGWAFTSVAIADVWQRTPFIIFLSLAALQSLPCSAMEAARIDGATGWQMIVYIKLPLMLPALLVTALLRLIDAFKVLEVILVMTNGGPGLSTEIFALRISRTASEFKELGYTAAMSNLLLILLMILTLAMFFYGKVMDARAARIRAESEEAH
ncbi:carbohydrate ABC transporter membrane protein 1, CUT1 family [Jannaschia faecimaris]|uniref:Carbohydrate ABC transporter membrane protein 1, CUT1 family n=1 Tax=Jannaschia faecimaris TaxID=1244108 RepID=A0A1H3TI95_9RHOB|nr:sugar ABC transporter permease [Jannaschia faecimaris]SDZ49936.1 carbohydrate ABC transporter membrane protein 1, CUT1 family [Jannaschia faecimaris]